MFVSFSLWSESDRKLLQQLGDVDVNFESEDEDADKGEVEKRMDP